MNPQRLNVFDFIGAGSLLASITFKGALEIAALFLTVAALAPLAWVRWRDLFRDKPAAEKLDPENPKS